MPRKSPRRSNRIVEEEVDEEMAYKSETLTLFAPRSLCSALEMLETALECFVRGEVSRRGADGGGQGRGEDLV